MHHCIFQQINQINWCDCNKMTLVNHVIIWMKMMHENFRDVWVLCIQHKYWCISIHFIYLFIKVFFIRFIYKSVSIILDCNYTNDDKGIRYKISWTLRSLLQSHLAATSHNIMALSFSSKRIWPNFTGGHDLTNQTSHINYNSFSYNCGCGGGRSPMF